MKNLDYIADELFNKIRGRYPNVTVGDNDATITNMPKEGRFFEFDFATDNSSWVDVVETDGTEVSYTVSAGNLVRVDPSGWAFASSGYIRVTSDSSEAADRNIVLHFRHS